MKPPASNPFAPRSYGQLTQVTDRVYLYRNIVNSSFVIGDKGVAVIDTQVNLPGARRIVDAVKSVTDKPILYAINTHYHWDHTNGNKVFRDLGAALFARRQTVDFMVNRAPRQKAFLSGRGLPLGQDPVLPENTFTGDIELDLGNQLLQLTFQGTAESEDATAVVIPAEKCVVAGDTVMTGSFPIFGQPVWNEGLMQQYDWLKAIDSIRKLGADHVLPGHGPLAHDAEIDLLVRIEQYFFDEVSKRVRAGMTLDQLIADLEPKMPQWITSIPVVWGCPRYGILRVYRGLIHDPIPGFQHFKPSAIPGADPAKVKAAADAAHDKKALLEAAEQCLEGDVGMGLALYREAANRFPDDPDTWVALADALVAGSRSIASVLEKGDFFVEAHAAVERALAVKPNFAPAYLFRGQFQIMSSFRNGDDPTPGLRQLEKAMECGLDAKGQAQVNFFLGLARRTVGDENGAKDFFRKALQVQPGYAQAALALMGNDMPRGPGRPTGV